MIRGSEWRRWDFHIHTPDTKKNDCFAGQNSQEKWDNFFKKINNYTGNVAVVGITDYCCIDNYFKFKATMEAGETVKGIELVIPNVELRITPVALSSPINIHLLFNPTIDTQIESRFFQKLRHDYLGTSYSASKEDLIRYGKKIDSSITNDRDAKLRAIENLVFPFNKLKEVFDGDKELRANSIIAVANSVQDGANGLREDSQLYSTQQSIYHFVDMIFSASPSDIEFFLGKRNKKKSQIISEFGALKPCINGCDAHELSKIFEPDAKRYCWIKADTTFNGLKQVIYEPEDRVFIGELPPEPKSDYQIIDYIKFNSPTDITTKPIYFNQNLNTIIGGRSSGKSILLGCLAKKIDAKVIPKKGNDKYNEMILTWAQNAEIKWRDGQSEASRQIEYFSQSEISNLCREREKINEIIQDILLKKEENYKALDTYRRFCTENQIAIEHLISDFFALQDRKDQIESDKKAIGDASGIAKEIEKIGAQISEHKEKMGNAIIDVEDAQFKELSSEYAKLHNKIVQTRKNIEILETLKDGNVLISNFPADINLLDEKLSEELREAFNRLQRDVRQQWATRIDEAIRNQNATIVALQTRCNEIVQNTIYVKCQTYYSENATYSQLESRQKEEQAKINAIKIHSQQIDNLQKDIQKCKENIFQCNKEYYVQAFPLIQNLQLEADEINITSYIHYRFTEIKEILSTHFNKQRYSTQEIIERCDKIKDADEYTTYLLNIFDKILSKEIIIKDSIQSTLRDILCFNLYDIRHNAFFQNDNLEQMSEGKIAFVILRLLLDFSEKECPILIDQPEDDLDNRAIYSELVKFLRIKKKKRQIIIATHNPNVVVSADAEEVIVANQHGSKNSNENNIKFDYYCGALENTQNHLSSNPFLRQQGIREHVCEILEGGEEAFKKREYKYGFSK